MKSRSSGIRWWTAAACTFAGMCLLFSPPGIGESIKLAAPDLLTPGQWAVHGVASRVAAIPKLVSWNSNDTARARELESRLAATESENQSLKLINARLRQQLVGDRTIRGPQPAATDQLLLPDLVPARIMGEMSAAVWRGGKFVSAGKSSGVQEAAFVLKDKRPLLDVGADHRLENDQAVYAGRIVVGRIAQVGRWSSTLQAITDRGYRGAAQLARRSGSDVVLGAQATLAGTGDELCELLHVWHTEAVHVGDEVVTAGLDGLLPEPMLYGVIVAAELPEGATEWTIRVKPASNGQTQAEVQILRLNPNSLRMVAN